MLNKNFLIFDFGASSGRASVAEFSGTGFSLNEIHRFENLPTTLNGTLFWNILSLFRELKKGIQLSLKRHRSLASIGVDTWGDDFGFIDKNKKLISNPVHYRDPLRNSVCEKLYKTIPANELFKLTGGQLVSEVSLFHLYVLKLQNSTELKSAERLLMVPDIFNFFLTGNLTNEYTVATTTLMFNPNTKKWVFEIFDRLGIRKDIFYDVIMPSTVIGNLSNNICSELEIDPVKVIAPPTHDTASAVSGIPVKSNSKNWGFISLGTWCILGVETNDFIINDEVVGTGFFNEGGVENKNLFVKDINGMWIIQKCRQKWIQDFNRDFSWSEIVELAKKAEPFSSMIDVDFQIFKSSINNMPAEIKKYCQKRLSRFHTKKKIPEDIGEVARTIYESLVLRFRYDIERLEKFTKNELESLYLIGGGTKNRLICQWTADATKKLVIVSPAETTSIGNLLMQLKGDGEIKNIEEGRILALASVETQEYYPQDTSRWDEEYDAYKKFIISVSS